MDAKIPNEVLSRRRRQRIVKILAWSVAGILAAVVLATLLRGSIRQSEVKLSKVERCTIDITVSTFGKVRPLREETVISPVSTKIEKVYMKTGDILTVGDLLLKLDLETANADYDRKRDELEMKRREIVKMKVNAETQIGEMEMQIKVDSLRLQRAEVMLKNESYLDSIGASTADRIRQAELDLEVQSLQYRQLKLKYVNMKKNMAEDVHVAEMDYKIAGKELELTARKLDEAQVRAPWSGTLTWINDQIGTRVSEGEKLATIADLGHFKIEAEIADSYADKIISGSAAIVEAGGMKLTGTVGNIVPSVENGQIRFTVTLEDDANPVLRPGLETDVYVINSIRDNVLSIDNISYYRGSGKYEMWVVNGNTAEKRMVILGESGYDKVEVVDGLSEGETVIVSDMARFSEKMKLRIRQ